MSIVHKWVSYFPKTVFHDQWLSGFVVIEGSEFEQFHSKDFLVNQNLKVALYIVIILLVETI